MHFGLALELPDMDLWNTDLLDTHLDLLDTDIPSKNFVCLHSVFKASSRYVFKTSSRHVFKTTSGHVFKICLQDVFKTSLRRLGRRKLLCWRRVEDVFKAYLEDVFKTSKCLLGINQMPIRFHVRWPLNISNSFHIVMIFNHHLITSYPLMLERYF